MTERERCGWPGTQYRDGRTPMRGCSRRLTGRYCRGCGPYCLHVREYAARGHESTRRRDNTTGMRSTHVATYPSKSGVERSTRAAAACTAVSAAATPTVSGTAACLPSGRHAPIGRRCAAPVHTAHPWPRQAHSSCMGACVRACCDTRRALAAAGAFCCRVERARSAPAEDGVVVGLDRRDVWEQRRHTPRERAACAHASAQ